MQTCVRKEAKEAAKAALHRIGELMHALLWATDANREERCAAVHESPLSVHLRSGWALLTQPLESAEFVILLRTTDYPSVRVRGELGDHRFPVLEYRDWGMPWTVYQTTAEEEYVLERYCAELVGG